MENTQKTILVVDDDPYNVDLVSRQLQAHGFRVLHTTDPETAYSLAEQNQPDLIISDLNMPGLDGFTLMSGLKNNRRTQTIPLILLTSSENPADREKGLSYGAKVFLNKPFDWDTAWPQIEPFLQKVA